MTWTLREHGDRFERDHWDLLQDTWPNYEVLWREFIVPLTGRPEHIQLRPDTDPLLEAMCMTHYSIFYHLGTAHGLLQALQNGSDSEYAECYDEIFFHMSSSTEMVQRFLLVLREIRNILGFYGKEYSTATAERLVSGRLANVRAELTTFLTSLDQPEELVKKLWKTGDDIRSYRNVMTHNPRIGTLIDPKGGTYLPKQHKLSEYRLWSSVIYRETSRSDFEPACAIVTRLLEAFESAVNQLWHQVLKLLGDWSSTEQYRNMLPSGSGTATPARAGSVIAVDKLTSMAKSGAGPTGEDRILPSGTAAIDDDTPDLGDPDGSAEPQ